MCIVLNFLNKKFDFLIEYFRCTSPGKFLDSFMNDNGKYFECTLSNQRKLQTNAFKYYLCFSFS